MGFVVHARLGRGRIVETFTATLQVNEERLSVVVKRPRPTYANNAALAQALTEWGQAQTEIDHPHIVAVFEAGQTKDGAYVIQERVDGVPLSQLLKVLRKKRRTLNHDFALVIATRLAAALEYLSQDGRTGHGFLDAGEVMLSYDGDLKVGDQGLGRLAGIVGSDLLPEPASSDIYAPPEVLAGEGHTPRSDVFALGLLILEMMIGHPVWASEAMTIPDAIEAISDFTHMGQASPELTHELLEILRPCLEEHPAARPASAAPVYQSLVELLERHRIRPDDAALGDFVHAVLPPADDGEAPTMMVDPEEAERLLKTRRRQADWEAASVMINPEIEARARSAYVQGRVLRSSPRPQPRTELSGAPASGPSAGPVGPSGVRSGSRSKMPARAGSPPAVPAAPNGRAGSGSVELVAEAVDLYAASPASLRKAVASARRPSSVIQQTPQLRAKPAIIPLLRQDRGGLDSVQAPSVLRDIAARVPNVMGVAASAYERFDRSRRNLLIGAVAAILTFAIALMFVGGDRPSKTMPTVRFVVSSEPERAQLWVDGSLLGQTPIDVPVPQTGEPYRLRFELSGYRAHEVTIGSSEDELRYEAVLRRSP